MNKKFNFIVALCLMAKLSFAIVNPTCKCGSWNYDKLDKVIAQYDSLIKVYPDSSDLYMIKGYYQRCVCRNNWDCHFIDSAILNQKKAIERDNKNIQAYEELGEIFIYEFDSLHFNIDSAYHYFSKSLELNTNSEISNTGMGKIFLFQNNYDQASEFFKKGIANKEFCKYEEYLGLTAISLKTHRLEDLKYYFPKLYEYTDGESELHYLRNDIQYYLYEKYVKNDITLQDKMYEWLFNSKDQKLEQGKGVVNGLLFDILYIDYFQCDPELMKQLSE